MKEILLYALLLIACNFRLKAEDKPLYKDATRPVEERIADLINRMTLEEKLLQISASVLRKNDMDSLGHFHPHASHQSLIQKGLGQLGKPCVAFDLDASQTARISNEIQRYVMENGRLGIPTIFHEEALHGLWARNSTVYPQALGLSCSWEPELVKDIFEQVALETRSRGSHQVNTPMLDVCRDPRWGRIEESYGEDPYLIACFAKAIVEGLQGTKKIVERNGIDSAHVIATIKHFAGYGVSERATNKGTVNYGERAMREVILPPFKVAVEEAGALSVMPGYHAVDGVPSHANHWLLNEILREEWHFKGYVVSDYGGIDGIKNDHRLAASTEEAAAKALLAGVDLELASPNCFRNLTNLCESNREMAVALDTAVARVLRMKFKLGLFEHPYANEDRASQVCHTKEQQALALKAAEKSIVLLKNEHETLPLDKAKIKTLAVIGPNAKVCRYGGYSHRDEARGISIYDGLKNKLGKELEILYAEGCKIHQNHGYWLDFKVDSVDQTEDIERIKEAVKVTQEADMVILALGGTAMTCGEFLGYRSSLDLYGNQNQLFEAVKATGKPVVVCLINGRPLTINAIDESADALLECWYLGEKTGEAVANVLAGDVVPSGKLTVTFPRSVGHLPQYYNALFKPKNGYLAVNNSPLYPFGYGLSYTSFAYSNLTLSKRVISADERLEVRVQVKNTGKYAADEIVQLYIQDEVSSVVRPLKELKKFKKISLQPGESKSVTFHLCVDDLMFYNVSNQYVWEPGTFKIMVGPHSEKWLDVSFSLE
ncbi:glycoside hydrolase family 3 C-terminal domain-containing protein [Carboxylicivirga sediminis]|uniref:beta-glucosidase n=1 Tax=Carboxylicivirga sediminis TaxID=2006564 RepID=A0A941F732_9BACT|nr:glycoside hydrolase family 3 N-terminal domain-containing protein [Carboxylicivirga sediminis]MBR8538011.1 glycoside hydrolase family 3 C-terminal domain-containing protein [Carboxylicivirga sediminis]